mgnify:FL=1
MSLSLGLDNLVLDGGHPLTLLRLCDEVCEYILNHNVEGRFNSAIRFPDNFRLTITRLIQEGQMMVFRNEKGISGICGWVLVDKIEDVQKLRWIIPKDITSGKILYILIGVLSKGTKILDIKKRFEELGYRKKVDRVFWYNSVKTRRFDKGAFHG